MQQPPPPPLRLLTRTNRVFFMHRLIPHTEASHNLPSSSSNSIIRHNLRLSNINSSSNSNNKLRINKPLSSHKLALVKCFITDQG
jgi:hypothetical protein